MKYHEIYCLLFFEKSPLLLLIILFSFSALGKPIIQRPIAGSQVMCSPLEKKMSECWSKIEPNIFKVRGRNYIRSELFRFVLYLLKYL